jgi:3-hydroxyacyl-[acyl-carrier protein] dehydratase / trans-2-decenoyl-[acyl-carrier protein] isomerase
LPLPPMLMFDRISSISDVGGAHGKGQIVAELKIAGNPALDWLWACHFKGDPVMPGCLGLDALWQMTGFFLGWLGAPGKGRALGVGEVKLKIMIVPSVKSIQYVVDIKRVILRKLKLAIADGIMTADGQIAYTATDLRVGLFEAGEQPAGA